MTGEALAAVSLPLEVGDPDFLLSGMGNGILALHRYAPGSDRLLQIKQFSVGGRIVAMIPWEGRPLLNQGVVVATANPDRLVFLQVLPQSPYLTIEGSVDLEEDPGTVSFIGELVGGTPELAVSLPGIDKVAFLRQEGDTWGITSVQDTGDQPQTIVGLDLDGDQIRELVMANRGPLSGTLGVFRRNPDGEYVPTWQDFAAGHPTELAVYDLDGDGLLELAAAVDGLPEVILLRAEAGELVDFESIPLTLPADSVHLTVLFDGTVGLFTSNRERGLVDFFQLHQGTWLRRNSYYPGCFPWAMASGDFNGDGGRDLVSLGGDLDVVTVMFANSQPGFWGFPALTLNANPAASAIADFDGDGIRDLVVSNGTQPVLSLFWGLTEGGFAMRGVDVTLPFYPGPVAALDADGDPAEELAILDSSGGLVFLADFVPGQGFSLVSQTPTGFSPFFISTRDVDMDGFFDLLIITREVDEVRVLFGSGDFSFPTQTAIDLPSGADWVEALDIDADGLPDLALTDGVNRLWTTLNQGDRSFGPLDWLNAGSGAGIMAVGDLDQDLDDDLIVVNYSDKSLSMFENTGSGSLVRRIGAHNLREERLLGISFPLTPWEYSMTAKYSGGPDVTIFNVEDFNFDDVPDILTLDRSLMLGLTMLNVEQELVAVHPEALSVTCGPRWLEIRIQPDRPGSWQVDFGVEGRWSPLAVSGQAVLGDLDYDSGTWILTVDRGDLPGSTRPGLLRLTVGEGAQREVLDISLAGLCPEIPTGDLPLVAWSSKPWPNPFNPLVNARFALSRGAADKLPSWPTAGSAPVTTPCSGTAGKRAGRWERESICFGSVPPRTPCSTRSCCSSNPPQVRARDT
jgi:hypothetical protein